METTIDEIIRDTRENILNNRCILCYNNTEIIKDIKICDMCKDRIIRKGAK